MTELLGNLEELSRVCALLVQNPYAGVDPEKQLLRLAAVVLELGEPARPRPAKCPPDYLRGWQLYLQHSAEPPARRAINYLCWEPDIAVQSAFLDILTSGSDVTARAIQGLLRSVHRKWRMVHKDHRILEKVASIIKDYSGRSRIVVRLREATPLLLGPDSTNRVGKELIARREDWKAWAGNWGLEPGTEFGLAVMESTVALGCTHTAAADDRVQEFLVSIVLSSPYWPPSNFKAAVQDVLLAQAASGPQAARDRLKQFILSDNRLLDPRLPRNSTNWTGISETAKATFIQWLSKDDIELFFNHVLHGAREDPHHRKPFWLTYLKQVVRSRPLLDSQAESRWLAGSDSKRSRNYGLMDNSSLTSAFLLDFGRVTVVEFGQVGNAAFVYSSKSFSLIVDNFWSQGRFKSTELKRKDLCIARVIHKPGWQDEMRGFLAQYGVRPTA